MQLTDAPDGGRRCSRCRRVKPLACFHRRGNGYQCYCKTCKRIAQARRRQTESYQEWNAEYLARPEVKERRQKQDHDRLPKRRARRKELRKTLRSRLKNSRASVKHRLRHAKTEERRAVLAAQLAAYDAEIARLDRDLAGGDTRPQRQKRIA